MARRNSLTLLATTLVGRSCFRRIPSYDVAALTDVTHVNLSDDKVTCLFLECLAFDVIVWMGSMTIQMCFIHQ